MTTKHIKYIATLVCYCPESQYMSMGFCSILIEMLYTCHSMLSLRSDRAIIESRCIFRVIDNFTDFVRLSSTEIKCSKLNVGRKPYQTVILEEYNGIYRKFSGYSEAYL